MAGKIFTEIVHFLFTENNLLFYKYLSCIRFFEGVDNGRKMLDRVVLHHESVEICISPNLDVLLKSFKPA